MNQQDHTLYLELLAICGDILEFMKNAKTFPSQLRFEVLNENCYDLMYLDLKQVIPKQQLYPKVPALEATCKQCWKFFLTPRNGSDKILDLQLGKKFEHKLIEFLGLKHIDCRKGDNQNKMYPDNVVFKNEKIVAYLEVKYQAAPWLWAYREEGTQRECYEGSPALDEKKLKQQYELIETGEITVPVYYVYWLDFPCLKGVFFVSAEDIHTYYTTEAKLFDRKERSGDFKTTGGQTRKVGATSKIHPSTMMMRPFSELMKELS